VSGFWDWTGYCMELAFLDALDRVKENHQWVSISCFQHGVARLGLCRVVALAPDRLHMERSTKIHSSKVEFWPPSFTQRSSGVEPLRALMVSYTPISHHQKKQGDASLPNERGGFQARAGKSGSISVGIIINLTPHTSTALIRPHPPRSNDL
jgi:hypothetical protein